MKEEFYSIKTVKPNLDQAEIAKRDMLHTKAFKENSKVYFALPCNPAGEDYKKIYSIPYGLFDMSNKKCILIESDLGIKFGRVKCF